MNSRVAVVVGSPTDLPHLEGCFETLREFGVSWEVRVLSAHRTPDRARKFARSARASGLQVLIAAAGGAAHLAGALAAHSLLPVIGVPIPATALNGLDALLSTVQMPAGIPVATMTMGKAGGTNAALFALAILALNDSTLAEALRLHREKMTAGVTAKDLEIQKHFASGDTSDAHRDH